VLFSEYLGPIEFWQLLSWAQIAGICAFTYITGQLILAARPFGLDKWLGVQNLLGFHSLMAIVGLCAGIFHYIVKFFIMESGYTVQTIFGFCSLILLLAMAVFTYLFISNTFVAKWKWIKRLREFSAKNWKWTYKGLRAVHNVMNLAVAGLIVHVLLASSLAYMTGALIWLLSWLGLGIVLYLVYRFRQRKGLGVAAKAPQK
jgi:predicted ferric reductase